MYSDPFSTTTPAGIGIKNPNCVKWRETLASQLSTVFLQCFAAAPIITPGTGTGGVQYQGSPEAPGRSTPAMDFGLEGIHTHITWVQRWFKQSFLFLFRFWIHTSSCSLRVDLGWRRAFSRATARLFHVGESRELLRAYLRAHRASSKATRRFLTT